jgi:hypothetical protein
MRAVRHAPQSMLQLLCLTGSYSANSIPPSIYAFSGNPAIALVPLNNPLMKLLLCGNRSPLWRRKSFRIAD